LERSSEVGEPAGAVATLQGQLVALGLRWTTVQA
jgi:hypothetical protein